MRYGGEKRVAKLIRLALITDTGAREGKTQTKIDLFPHSPNVNLTRKSWEKMLRVIQF